MHFVTESATLRTGRRSATALHIMRAARRLTDERGPDGFTMEDLAAEADVSRRTLFNHCAGKLEAILGPPPAFPDRLLELFRGGGPHGNLVLDLRDLAHATLAVEQLDREELARVRRILQTSPKLLAAVHDRFLTLSEQLVHEIELREGPAFGRRRAQVAIGVLASLFDNALRAFLDDEQQRPLTHHFDEAIQLARELFG